MGLKVNTQAIAVGQKLESYTPTPHQNSDLRHNEQLVYDELCKTKNPKKAYDLLNSLHDQGLRAPMTIYRALETLIAKGHVRKIESLNAFIATNPDRQEKLTAYLICKDCMKAKEIEVDEQKIAGLFSPLEVSLDNIRIEAFGSCKQVCNG